MKNETVEKDSPPRLSRRSACPPPGGAGLGSVRRVLLLLAAGSALVFLLGRDALPALLHRVLVLGDRTPVAMMTGLDSFLRKNVPDGNLFIQFRGFEDQEAPRPGEMSGLDTASLIYFRTVYALYPRRVYTGPEERPITRGTEFIFNPFYPTAAWLRERGVHRVLTFARDPEGNIYQEIQLVPGK
jgi:hypothetical protein